MASAGPKLDHRPVEGFSTVEVALSPDDVGEVDCGTHCDNRVVGLDRRPVEPLRLLESVHPQQEMPEIDGLLNPTAGSSPSAATAPARPRQIVPHRPTPYRDRGAARAIGPAPSSRTPADRTCPRHGAGGVVTAVAQHPRRRRLARRRANGPSIMRRPPPRRTCRPRRGRERHRDPDGEPPGEVVEGDRMDARRLRDTDSMTSS